MSSANSISLEESEICERVRSKFVNNVIYLLRFIEIQSAAPDSTSDGDKGRGPQKRKHVEDAKIAELLNRQDTAVIYPEPCEDGDEQHNEGQFRPPISNINMDLPLFSSIFSFSQNVFKRPVFKRQDCVLQG